MGGWKFSWNYWFTEFYLTSFIPESNVFTVFRNKINGRDRQFTRDSVTEVWNYFISDLCVNSAGNCKNTFNRNRKGSARTWRAVYLLIIPVENTKTRGWITAVRAVRISLIDRSVVEFECSRFNTRGNLNWILEYRWLLKIPCLPVLKRYRYGKRGAVNYKRSLFCRCNWTAGKLWNSPDRIIPLRVCGGVYILNRKSGLHTA